MVNVDWNPDRKKLREFGLISLAGFGLIGLVLGWRFDWIKDGKWLYPGVIWGVGLLSSILALIEPLLLKPIYWIMTAISAVVGLVVGTIVLFMVYILVFLPIGLVFALRGRDELQLKWDPQSESYWLPADLPQHPGRYLRQF